MSKSVATAMRELVDHRRGQLTRLVESVQAALDLTEVVEQESARRDFATVDQFLAGAPDEIERARWAGLVDRAVNLDLKENP